MKSGKLAHVIEVQRAAVVVNDAGTPTSTWSKVATLRAEVVEESAEEFLRNAGETTVTAIVFCTRFAPDITDNDRISFDGEAYDIDKIVHIGRRRGLEFHCTRVEP
ncbi:phage head closure protein [Citreimonas salinaria]|uniref:Phage head-tail adaptor, putative, SPP1 family n=1 Tax=Citreimonas salinaria TaxID=321339 RepID=A0A1H3HRU3_9RHOB|nr:phage head closure protein [Citreimonas salinaria]SDY18152.1 phage head-tail adaptor, putative, SPP1 family [Citreimonas salinaria]